MLAPLLGRSASRQSVRHSSASVLKVRPPIGVRMRPAHSASCSQPDGTVRCCINMLQSLFPSWPLY